MKQITYPFFSGLQGSHNPANLSWVVEIIDEMVGFEAHTIYSRSLISSLHPAYKTTNH